MVKDILNRLDLTYKNVELGEVVLNKKLSNVKHDLLKVQLKSVGFELMDDKKEVLINKTKMVINELIFYSDEIPNINLSEYLSEKLHVPYPNLSTLFSETKGITIEHYTILQKIEKVKEMILYEEYTISEIAFKLNYSSAGHLSNQFKKITGLTPAYFKKIKKVKFVPVD
jgi:AraC-like DNA-binding protein